MSNPSGLITHGNAFKIFLRARDGKPTQARLRPEPTDTNPQYRLVKESA